MPFLPPNQQCQSNFLHLLWFIASSLHNCLAEIILMRIWKVLVYPERMQCFWNKVTMKVKWLQLAYLNSPGRCPVNQYCACVAVCRRWWYPGTLHIWLGSHSVVCVTTAAVSVGWGGNSPVTFCTGNTLPHHCIRLVPLWVWLIAMCEWTTYAEKLLDRQLSLPHRAIIEG